MMADDEGYDRRNARRNDPETSHEGTTGIKKHDLALLADFFRSHDDDPSRGWTQGEVYDTRATPLARDIIWRRMPDLHYNVDPPVLEWVLTPEGKHVTRVWPTTGKPQRARRLRHYPPVEEKKLMIDPGLIDEAYKAYQELDLLAPLRAQSPFVPGDGPLNAVVMLIGEAPGAQEVVQLKPFVGPSGKLLDTLLAERGLPRWACYTTNVVLYRPPDNRKPEQWEIAISRERLFAEIRAIQPSMVVTLGATARQALKPQGAPVSECHGQVEQVDWMQGLYQSQRFLMLPTFHPSAALRNPQVLELMRADLTVMPDWRKILGTP